MGKKRYYEIIPQEGGEKDQAVESKAVTDGADAIEPERDRYAELMAAAKRIRRVRFRVSPDYGGSASSIALVLSIILIVGGIFLMTIESGVGKLVIGILMGAAVIAAVVAMMMNTSRSKKEWYCYYVNTERGVFCMSVVEDRAAIFANGAAYRIADELFYSPDERGFCEFFDGECAGILSVLAASRGDVEVIDDGVFRIKNRAGGEHRVYLEGGEIVCIESDQPERTDDIDQKTGERRIKLRTFVKSDPTDDFTVEVPDFVRRAFEANHVPLPDIEGAFARTE